MPSRRTGHCPRPRPRPRPRHSPLPALAALLALAACRPSQPSQRSGAAPADGQEAQPAAAPAHAQHAGACEGDTPEVLATLDGTPIRVEEVASRVALRLYQIEADRYTLLQRELDQIIEQRLLAREAERRAITVEALLEAETAARAKPVTDADVDAYLAEHPRDAARGPAVRPRIAAYLAERRAIEQRLQLVERLRAQADLDILLRAPERPRTDIDIAGAPARGPADAPVTLVHFASFTSAASARSAAAIQALVDAYPDRIRWVHRHYLETYDELGLRAAELSMAAQDAGRFWELHDLAFARGHALTQEGLAEIARRLGLQDAPADAFARVKRHLDAGVKAGVERLPVVFVNGRYFSGTFSNDRLRALVTDELGAAAAPKRD